MGNLISHDLFIFFVVWLIWVVCLLGACILTPILTAPLLLIDWLVFHVWLGRKSEKCERFFRLSAWWLTYAFVLPKKMKSLGWGIVSMLISPMMLVFNLIPILLLGLMASGLESDEERMRRLCPDYEMDNYETDAAPATTSYVTPVTTSYVTREQVAAITGLADFPAFTCTRGDEASGTGCTTHYYSFDKPLTAAFEKKLKAMCDDPDNCLWSISTGGSYVLQRAWDGKYIKSPIKGVEADRIKMTIFDNGCFIIESFGGLSVPLDEVADPKTLNENMGVTFPKYHVEYFKGSANLAWYTAYLLLDEKPSQAFIEQLEKSPKWERQADGSFKYDLVSSSGGTCLYYCERSAVVNPQSRLIVASYSSN